jgi:hypothetical protein
MNRAIAILCLGLVATGTIAGGGSHLVWSHELPKEVATGVPAANRTPKAVDALFVLDSTRPTVDEVVAKLGQPDGFSAQGQTVGGTLQFLLSDGGELRVRTGDFHAIFEALRIDRRGKGKLLWK